MKAIFRYPGSKWSLAQWIISFFPEGYEKIVYLEPFLGSGAVFFNKRPGTVETINDLNGDVVNLFRVLRDRPEDLKRVLDLTPYSEQVFDAETATLAADAIEQLQSRLAQITAERHGRWIKKHDNVVYWYACSECGEETPCNKWGHRCFSRFCPSCGSRMDLEVNEYA